MGEKPRRCLVVHGPSMGMMDHFSGVISCSLQGPLGSTSFSIHFELSCSQLSSHHFSLFDLWVLLHVPLVAPFVELPNDLPGSALFLDLSEMPPAVLKSLPRTSASSREGVAGDTAVREPGTNRKSR